MLKRCTTVFAIAGLGVLPAAWGTLQAQKPALSTPAPVDFIRDIQPILENTCYECHGSKKTKAHLRLDSRAGLMKGGETGSIVMGWGGSRRKACPRPQKRRWKRSCAASRST